jgi:uncharacterized protein (DUF433 family)
LSWAKPKEIPLFPFFNYDHIFKAINRAFRIVHFTIWLDRPKIVKLNQNSWFLKQGALFVMKFIRITVKPDQMGGVPCIRGLRIPVATIIGMVAEGMSHEEILKAYPDLETEDLQEALHFAAEAVRERELPLAS